MNISVIDHIKLKITFEKFHLILLVKINRNISTFSFPMTAT